MGLYQTYVATSSNQVEVEIAFGSLPTKGNDIQPETEFADSANGSKRRSIVWLGLPTTNFNARCYYGLLYAFYHELIVHSVQALASPKKRVPYGEDCAFAEGLVDAVSCSAMSDLLEKGKVPNELKKHSKSFELQGWLRYRQRADYLRATSVAKGTQTTPQMKAAHAIAAAQELYGWLLRWRDRDWTFKLILSLNLEALSKHERNKLVARLYDVAESRDFATDLRKLPLHRDHAVFLTALQQYWKDGDISVVMEILEASD
jgi:hypothetical protein